MLSHGNGFAIDGYFSFWSRFLGSFDVVVFDMRSHGQNPRAEPPNHDYAHMVPDLDGICRAVGEEFGEKPTAGVFHSMSAQCAMLQALAGRSDFAALILFDPPDVPPPGHPVRGKMEDYEHKLARWARQRRTHFDEPLELAEDYASTRSGQRWAEGAAEQMARAVLQPDPAGGWRLACPTELTARQTIPAAAAALTSTWNRRDPRPLITPASLDGGPVARGSRPVPPRCQEHSEPDCGFHLSNSRAATADTPVRSWAGRATTRPARRLPSAYKRRSTRVQF